MIEAAEHNPDNELVWLWRASAARTRAEALDAVQRVLGLNPTNEKALQWVEKLRPGHVSGAVEEARDRAEPASNGHSNGIAHAERGEVEHVEEERAADPEEADAEQEATGSGAAEALETEAAAEETSGEEPAEIEIRSSAQDSVVEDESATEEHLVRDRGPEPPADAEARLAALEAYLQRGGREEAEEEGDLATQEVEGYGLGGREESDEHANSDTDDDLTSLVEAAERDEEDEDRHDPLIALLDATEKPAKTSEEESYHEPVDGDVESDPAQDQEYRQRLDELESHRAAEDDVWASLGMAGMDERPAPTAESRDKGAPAKAKAAGMGFAEAAASPAAAKESPAETPARVTDEGETAEEGCFICEKLAPQQEGVCSSCRSIVDIKLHELAPRHEGADRTTLGAALDRVRAKLDERPSADLCIQAALVSLNMKQSQQALGYMKEACRLRPHDRDLLGYYDQIESRPLILAVDDSKTVQKMISTVLEKESYRVLAAEDGLAALAKLDEEMPQLILLDITMPRMDGYQVCKVINGNDATKHIPVIMLSGKDGFFDKVRGKMVGASNYITKPFDPTDLTKTIAKFIKKGK